MERDKVFNRKEFRGTKLSEVAKANERYDNLFPKKGGEHGYVKLTDGENYLRICPVVPGSAGKSYLEVSVKSFMSMKVPIKDDEGNVLPGQSKFKKLPVLNAKFHGLTASGEPLKVDLVDEYLNILHLRLKRKHKDNKEAFNEEWDKTKYPSVDSIHPSSRWCMYVLQYIELEEKWVLGLFEAPVTVKRGLDKLEKVYEGGGRETDLFTDPDNGYPVKVVLDKTKKGNEMYNVTIPKQSKQTENGMEDFMAKRPMSNEQLMELAEQPPVHELYRGRYNKETLEQQKEGLSFFDKKYGHGIVGCSEWCRAVEYLEREAPSATGEYEGSSKTSKGGFPGMNNGNGIANGSGPGITSVGMVSGPGTTAEVNEVPERTTTVASVTEEEGDGTSIDNILNGL